MYTGQSLPLVICLCGTTICQWMFLGYFSQSGKKTKRYLSGSFFSTEVWFGVDWIHLYLSEGLNPVHAVGVQWMCQEVSISWHLRQCSVFNFGEVVFFHIVLNLNKYQKHGTESKPVRVNCMLHCGRWVLHQTVWCWVEAYQLVWWSHH